MANKRKFEIPERLAGPPAWLTEQTGEDQTAQIAEDLVSLHFWKEIDDMAAAAALKRIRKHPEWEVLKPLRSQVPEVQEAYQTFLVEEQAIAVELFGKDVYAKQRALAIAGDLGYDKAVSLEEQMGQVRTRIAMMLQEEGLLPYLEYDTVEAYLLDKMAPWDGNGPIPPTHSEVSFMLTYLIPVMEANGFDREQIVGVAKNFWKAKEAIPYLRQILGDVITKANEIRSVLAAVDDEEEKRLLNVSLNEALALDPRLHEVLEALVKEMVLTSKSGGMSTQEFRAKLRQIRTGQKDVLTPALGYIYAGAHGTFITITVENTRQLNTLKARLSGLVDLHQGDPMDLAREAGKILVGEELLDERGKL